MGLDMVYQALPENPDWWQRILTDSESREGFCLLPHYITQRGKAPGAGNLARTAWSLIHNHPGIERRNFRLDRSWDRLHYLLSEPRRNGDATASDLGSIAIRGSQTITWQGEPIPGAQAIPLRYTAPNDVAKIAAFLAAIPDHALRAFYHPPEMEAAGVYKSPTSEDAFTSDLHYFQGLRDFYQTTATHKEGVLVCLG